MKQMRKNIKTTLALLIGLISSLYVDGATLSEQADSAYMREDYTAAVELYNQSLAKEGSSAALYYNLGNSYYRTGHTGQAILNYEKALKLDPTNSNAKANLEFLNNKIIDKVSDRGTVLSKMSDSAVGAMTANGWAWIAMVLFVITIAAAACYAFADNVTLRKASFFGGGVTLLGAIITVVFAIMGAKRVQADNEAIIIVESTQLSTSPRTPKDKSEEAMLLHEGTKVVILDSVATPIDSVNPMWYDVVIDNTHRAWISSRTVAKI